MAKMKAIPTIPKVMNEVVARESVNTYIIKISNSKPIKKNNSNDFRILNLLLVLYDENSTKKKWSPFSITKIKACTKAES